MLTEKYYDLTVYKIVLSCVKAPLYLFTILSCILKEFIFFKFTFVFLFGLHTSLVSQPLPKSKKTQSKGGKKERTSSGTTRKAKRAKYPEILSDESSSEEDEKKEKDESSEEKESEDEVMSCFICFSALLSIGNSWNPELGSKLCLTEKKGNTIYKRFS